MGLAGCTVLSGEDLVGLESGEWCVLARFLGRLPWQGRARAGLEGQLLEGWALLAAARALSAPAARFGVSGT